MVALPTLHRRTGQLHAMVDMNLNHIRALSTPGIGVVVISPAVGAGMALEIMVPVHIIATVPAPSKSGIPIVRQRGFLIVPPLTQPLPRIVAHMPLS